MRGEQIRQFRETLPGHIAEMAVVVCVFADPVDEAGGGFAFVVPGVLEHLGAEFRRIVVPVRFVVVADRAEGQVGRQRLPGVGVLAGEELVSGFVVAARQAQVFLGGAV